MCVRERENEVPHKVKRELLIVHKREERAY